jgi:RNase P subunit RPR2
LIIISGKTVKIFVRIEKENEMADNFSEAIKVKEIEEIYDILEKKFCPDCYLNLEVKSQATTHVDDKTYDNIIAGCPDCGKEFTYIFDVSEPFKAKSKFL